MSHDEEGQPIYLSRRGLIHRTLGLGLGMTAFEPLLRAEFTFRSGLLEREPSLAEEIRRSSVQTVSMHVRRADYAQDPGVRERMLDILQVTGVVVVAGRTGNEKVWELADRWFPAWTPRERLTEQQKELNRQASQLQAWLAEVTPGQLAQTAPVPDDDRWPPYAKGRTVRQCLGTVLNEEWAHHGFCVRDLDKLSGQEAP